MMFSHYFDLSKWLIKGKNKITLGLIVSNPNLLGPSHNSSACENISVTPDSFEMLGKWKDGKTDNYMEEYSFVKTII